MIDLHNHLLPNIDDGSTSVERSLEVLALFAGHGVSDVVLTPHVNASEIGERAHHALARRGEAFARLDGAAALEPHLHLGFEIKLDEPPAETMARDRRFALAGSRYYLVEFPLSVTEPFARVALARLAQAGVVPIVAHPERYHAIPPNFVEAWRVLGARIQLDATTLTRATPRGTRARALLARGLADVVAADNHGDRRSMRTARTYLEEHGHHEAAWRLTVVNPRAVIDDGEMVEVPEVEVKRGMLSRLRRLLG